MLLTILDAVYPDTVDEKAIVAIPSKQAYLPIFDVPSTREGSDVTLINEPPLANSEPEAANLCIWWRRGRVGLGLKHGMAVLVTIGRGIRGR